MSASAYHLFFDIYLRKRNLISEKLDAEKFMLRDDLIACRGSRGAFPDLVLRTNTNDPTFQGGEFIEIKDSKTAYSIPSFNSTMPSARKNIRDHIGPNSKLYRLIRQFDGKDPYLLEQREVYYLIRGRKKHNCKVCLVHGSF